MHKFITFFLMSIAGLSCFHNSFSLDHSGCDFMLVFRLDLTYQEELGNFDPANGQAYVSLNGVEYEMVQSVKDSVPEAIFDIILTEGQLDFRSGTYFIYNFKMNTKKEAVQRDPVYGSCSDRPITRYFNDEKPSNGREEQKSNLTLVVDMKFQALEGKFDPSTDFVDISGNFNEWNGMFHHLTDEDGDSTYEITLEDLTPGQAIEYLFRINGDTENSEFQGIPSKRNATVIFEDREVISVFNNYKPGYIPVVLSVNMKNEIAKGKFYPGYSFVDVAGSLNGWIGTEELSDPDEDGIYITVPPCIAPAGDTMKYKFRINGSWAPDKCEFYQSELSRAMFIVDSVGGTKNEADLVWFNNIVLHDESLKNDLIKVKFSIDEVVDQIKFENMEGVNAIKIHDILGRSVYYRKFQNIDFYLMNIGTLDDGNLYHDIFIHIRAEPYP